MSTLEVKSDAPAAMAVSDYNDVLIITEHKGDFKRGQSKPAVTSHDAALPLDEESKCLETHLRRFRFMRSFPTEGYERISVERYVRMFRFLVPPAVAGTGSAKDKTKNLCILVYIQKTFGFGDLVFGIKTKDILERHFPGQVMLLMEDFEQFKFIRSLSRAHYRPGISLWSVDMILQKAKDDATFASLRKLLWVVALPLLPTSNVVGRLLMDPSEVLVSDKGGILSLYWRPSRIGSMLICNTDEFNGERTRLSMFVDFESESSRQSAPSVSRLPMAPGSSDFVSQESVSRLTCADSAVAVGLESKQESRKRKSSGSDEDSNDVSGGDRKRRKLDRDADDGNVCTEHGVCSDAQVVARILEEFGGARWALHEHAKVQQALKCLHTRSTLDELAGLWMEPERLHVARELEQLIVHAKHGCSMVSHGQGTVTCREHRLVFDPAHRLSRDSISGSPSLYSCSGIGINAHGMPTSGIHLDPMHVSGAAEAKVHAHVHVKGQDGSLVLKSASSIRPGASSIRHRSIRVFLSLMCADPGDFYFAYNSDGNNRYLGEFIGALLVAHRHKAKRDALGSQLAERAAVSKRLLGLSDAGEGKIPGDSERNRQFRIDDQGLAHPMPVNVIVVTSLKTRPAVALYIAVNVLGMPSLDDCQLQSLDYGDKRFDDSYRDGRVPHDSSMSSVMTFVDPESPRSTLLRILFVSDLKRTDTVTLMRESRPQVFVSGDQSWAEAISMYKVGRPKHVFYQVQPWKHSLLENWSNVVKYLVVHHSGTDKEKMALRKLFLVLLPHSRVEDDVSSARPKDEGQVSRSGSTFADTSTSAASGAVDSESKQATPTEPEHDVTYRAEAVELVGLLLALDSDGMLGASELVSREIDALFNIEPTLLCIVNQAVDMSEQSMRTDVAPDGFEVRLRAHLTRYGDKDAKEQDFQDLFEDTLLQSVCSLF